jgi:Tc toxin complex TcA C-terminal TcB-binding domain
MEPQYMVENKYTYLVGPIRAAASSIFVNPSPEATFENTVQSLFSDAQQHLQDHEYNLALDAFRELMALILRTTDPRIPVDPNRAHFTFPMDIALVDTFISKSVDILKALPVVQYALPSSVGSAVSVLPAAVATELSSATAAGLRVTSFEASVGMSLGAALAQVNSSDWTGAIASYQAAVDATPATATALRAALFQDMAVLTEKSGDQAGALTLAQQAIAETVPAADADLHVAVLDTATGIAQRAGNATLATQLSGQASQVRSTTNLNPIVLSNVASPLAPGAGVMRQLAARVAVPAAAAISMPISVSASAPAAAPAAAPAPSAASAAPAVTVAAPTLLAAQVLSESVPVKSFVAQGLSANAEIVLDTNAAASSKTFFEGLATTADLGLLTRYLTDPVQMIAYLPHMYFFVIPMSIGDCLAGMGDLDAAVGQYQSVLVYPYINVTAEIVRVWTRLAQAYLDLGDQAYRNARDDASGYPAARTNYENIVLIDSTLPPASPLYTDARFGPIATRVRAFLLATDKAASTDNPAVTSIVLQALGRIQLIQQSLNFFGFGPNYVPPFSFEYLQNTAKYFAQQASQAEQRYIQFQSQAENAELDRDQMNQQAEVARQSVVLQQRTVDEAQRGVDVATATANYANMQLANANAAKSDFNDTRWEELELDQAEAWASASAVDHDDEVKLSWSGTYYNSNNKPRNEVLQDLAAQRTQLSQDLESNRLDRDIASSQSYLAVAQAQINDAQARVAVAQQQVVVAQLQQANAEQNRDFLDMREFGAQLWYELAGQAERLKQRYLDMATEIAFLTERAYNAETDRGLHVVQYDYQHTASGNLMGADQLQADLDYFTLDLITTTKTKKLPVKTTISLADSYPTQFQSLKSSGICMFQTQLQDFDRAYPGLYLSKIRNVELVFVGVTSATSVAGTLRNVGASSFRDSAGNIVQRLYPADVMALSQFDLRQDALVFPFNPNDLRLFENNGIATLWQLTLPPSANDFNFADILDVHFVLYFDGFYNYQLEAQIRAGLPAASTASKAFAMSMYFPDELFYLKSQGQAQLTIDASMFPYSQTKLVRNRTRLSLSGDAQAVQNVTIRMVANAVGPNAIVLKTDATGTVNDSVAGSALAALQGKPMLDQLSLTITAADNPQLVHNGVLDLSAISDVLLFTEYGFTYR